MFFEFGEAYSAWETKQLIWTMVSFYSLEHEIWKVYLDLIT